MQVQIKVACDFSPNFDLLGAMRIFQCDVNPSHMILIEILSEKQINMLLTSVFPYLITGPRVSIILFGSLFSIKFLQFNSRFLKYKFQYENAEV